jgi:hypothetical protein
MSYRLLRAINDDGLGSTLTPGGLTARQSHADSAAERRGADPGWCYTSDLGFQIGSGRRESDPHDQLGRSVGRHSA